MKHSIRTLAAILILAHSLSATDAAPKPVQLFDGKTLEGWVKRGGNAEYSIEDGSIVGHSALNTPNTFLCTENDYGDFILELEFKVDSKLNSGVQIRSQHFAEATKAVDSEGNPVLAPNGNEITVPAGRVHGYQVEIDPSPRAYSGGIFDEARRGWLFDLKDNKPARDAFKQDEWNKFRVEARGESIQTWINGVMAADLRDSATAKGFIALQVHGIGNNRDKEGVEVRWRNITLEELGRE